MPTSVEQAYDICTVVDRAGRVLSVVQLDAEQKACILAHVRQWDFATFGTCVTQSLILDLPLPTDERAVVGSEGRSGADTCGSGGRTRG
jgi:hypothetical protein